MQQKWSHIAVIPDANGYRRRNHHKCLEGRARVHGVPTAPWGKAACRQAIKLLKSRPQPLTFDNASTKLSSSVSIIKCIMRLCIRADGHLFVRFSRSVAHPNTNQRYSCQRFERCNSAIGDNAFLQAVRQNQESLSRRHPASRGAGLASHL